MNVRKRGLALLMCICMVFTLLPFSVFAEDAENGNRGGTEGTAQPSVVYGQYVNGTWKQDANAKDTVEYGTEGDNTLSLTKTAVKKSDNTYDITLKVVSTQTKTTTKPGSAATVLVMDVSGSMAFCANCGKEKHDKNDKHAFESRIAAAKDAAYSFILSYSGAVLEDGQVTGLKENAADGLGRYVSVVSFSKGSSVACDWQDVSTQAGYNAVKTAIDRLKADGGTNLDAGLQTANTQFSDETVKGITAKNVIALTDGMPTRYQSKYGSVSQHGSYGCPDTNNATAKSATALKENASVYTVCFGAADQKCWVEGSEHNWLLSEWHAQDGPTVGDFLRDNIATQATYAYNADNTTELMKVFKAITSSITEGIKTGTVLDPMGDHITVISKPDNFVETPTGYKWELSDPTVATDGDKTTYTYTLTYTVTFDPNFAEFHENNYYAANGVTTFTPAGSSTSYNFNVPGVKGTAPEYKVTYEFEGTCPDSVAVPASEQHKAGDTVTMPEITAPEGWIFNGWKYNGNAVTSVKMPANDITIIGTFTEQKAYTVKYLLKGTDISVKDAETGIKNVGESVSAVAPDLTGYTFAGTDADKNQTITVVSDASQNVITFYYYKNVTVTANDDTKVYGDNDPAAFGATVTGTRDGETVVYTVGRADGENVGNYAITPTGDEIQGYYKVEYKTGSFEITARPVTLTGQSATRTYTGQEIELTGITPDGLLVGHNASNLTYSARGINVGGPYNGKFNVEAKDVRIIDAENNDVSENYNVMLVPGELTIVKADAVIVKITGKTDTKVYNGSQQTFTGYDVVIENNPNNAYKETDFSLKTGADVTASGINVGKYTMGLTADSFVNNNTNFDVTFVIVKDGSLTITKRPLTIIGENSDPEEITYDGQTHEYINWSQAPATDNSGLVRGHKITGIKYLLTGKDAGSYTGKFSGDAKIMSGEENVTENYSIEYTLGKMKIVPAERIAVKIIGNHKEVWYNGQEQSVSGFTFDVADNTVTVELKDGHYAIAKGTNVKTYYMGLKSDDFTINHKNYKEVSVEIVDGYLTIKRHYTPNPPITDKITVEITGNSDSVVYDGTEHSVKDYTVKISDSRYTEKDFTFSGKALASGVNAGIYEMGLKADQFKNTNARFTNVEFIIKADGVLTITQRPLTITAGSAEGIAPVTCDKYTVEGLATGDKVDSVKITGIQSEPGESPNVASDAVIKNAKGEDVTANYKITYVDGVLKAIEVLNKEIHFNYVIGYTDGTIRPNNDISRAEVATIFFRLLTDEAREQYTTTAGNFTDVKAGMWCNRAIATLTNMGIIKGYTDGSFQPNKSITRAELATIIARFAKLDVNTKTFSDITGHWAQKNIELAAGNGWINGYEDGTFRPNNNITRAETFAMINRVLDRQTESVSDLLPTSEMNMWSDNLNENAWYYKDVQEATNYHKCDRVGDSVYEKWTEKVPDIDWASYQI